MQTGETHNMTGRLTIRVLSDDGTVIEERQIKNLITTRGRAAVAQLFAGVKAKPALFIAVGDNNGQLQPPASPDNVKLGRELEKVPVTITDADVQSNAVTVVARLSRPPADQKRDLREAGIILKLGSEEILYNRVLFEAVMTQTASTDITLSWAVTF